MLEQVEHHLAGRLALPFSTPGRFSFDAGTGIELVSGLDQGGAAPESV
ncbi:hypothetical protein KBY58_07370 [Cyanobium sp. HWJ4-Hawea]|nr:hypothetical protein [Cyanobium sp. HWJ4-Hawea]MCP9809251.1 hypothetical protein [Cyanobium sp. HWJ4-Hawea]